MHVLKSLTADTSRAAQSPGQRAQTPPTCKRFRSRAKREPPLGCTACTVGTGVELRLFSKTRWPEKIHNACSVRWFLVMTDHVRATRCHLKPSPFYLNPFHPIASVAFSDSMKVVRRRCRRIIVLFGTSAVRSTSAVT